MKTRYLDPGLRKYVCSDYYWTTVFFFFLLYHSVNFNFIKIKILDIKTKIKEAKITLLQKNIGFVAG